MASTRTEELLEKQICLSLHLRGVSQKNIALFIGKKKAYVNAILKPLQTSKDGDPE
jgi:transcriptional regulator